MTLATLKNDRTWRSFCMVLVGAYLWINASEIFRYFVFVMPMTRTAMSAIPDVAPMNMPVFLIWALWDTLLFAVVAFIAWLFHEKFGDGIRNVFAAGTLLWAAIFCILWLGLYNMNLTVPRVPLIALPLAWIEMVVAVAVLKRAWPHLLQK